MQARLRIWFCSDRSFLVLKDYCVLCPAADQVYAVPGGFFVFVALGAIGNGFAVTPFQAPAPFLFCIFIKEKLNHETLQNYHDESE